MTNSIRATTGSGILLAVVALLLPVLTLADTVPARNDSLPEVDNVHARQRQGTFLVDITYDVAYSGGNFVHVAAFLSFDNGLSFPIYCSSVTGDYGTQLANGTNRTILWDAGADWPDFMSDDCRIRVMAYDHHHQEPYCQFWKSNLGGSNPVAFASHDTVAYGEPFRLSWEGIAPALAEVDPQVIAVYDTVPPVSDGILGYQHLLPGFDGDPGTEDVWRPLRFDEATGDSVSYFAAITSLGFRNDGSGPGIFERVLGSGAHRFRFKALDITDTETSASHQFLSVVVNYDPETIVFKGESDPLFPEDIEIYPYYILLNDPTQTHYPFLEGDRIPDRTYVVFKALTRDDPRDLISDPGASSGMAGAFQSRLVWADGGIFAHMTDYSEVSTDSPWNQGSGGWYADTLGFMPPPHGDIQVMMAGVDEHGRRDGTPATFEFSVGYEPCVQGIELLPRSDSVSAFDENLACYDPGGGSHPCFDDTTVFHIKIVGQAEEPGRTYLQNHELGTLAVDRSTGDVQYVLDTTGMSETHYLVLALRYRMDLLLHGRDHGSEMWPDPVLRTGAWKYQVDYACDPSNETHDGVGIDDISVPLWGRAEPDDSEPQIGADGVWRFGIDVPVPLYLLVSDPDAYLSYLRDQITGHDTQQAEWLFYLTTRQLGIGLVQAVALDQTLCDFWPLRPAKYHFFTGVRPPQPSPPAGMTWRDCYLESSMVGIESSLGLADLRMGSNGDTPVTKYFRLVVQTSSGGDYECVDIGF